MQPFAFWSLDMPTVRSLVLHLAIATVATLMVAAAAVAIGLSGAHSFGGRLGSDESLRVAGDWPQGPLARTPVPARPIQGRSTID
jgi:hypothetical protein